MKNTNDILAGLITKGYNKNKFYASIFGDWIGGGIFVERISFNKNLGEVRVAFKVNPSDTTISSYNLYMTFDKNENGENRATFTQYTTMRVIVWSLSNYLSHFRDSIIENLDFCKKEFLIEADKTDMEAKMKQQPEFAISDAAIPELTPIGKENLISKDDQIIDKKSESVVTDDQKVNNSLDIDQMNKSITYWFKLQEWEKKAESMSEADKEFINGMFNIFNQHLKDRLWKNVEDLSTVIDSFFIKKDDILQRAHAQLDKEHWMTELEVANIPHRGRLADHIIQNGTSEIEWSTKKLIIQYGKKMVSSWWDEYRGEPIDF